MGFFLIPNYMRTIGKIHKTKGYDGTLIVEWLFPILNQTMKACFAMKNGKRLPLLIHQIDYKDAFTAHIVFKKYESKELAQSLHGLNIEIDESQASSMFDLEEIENYENYLVYNFDIKIGQVERVIDQGYQETLEVKLENGKKLLIPFVEEIILTIDVSITSLYVELDDHFIETFSS